MTSKKNPVNPRRRQAVKLLGAVAASSSISSLKRYAQAQTSEPIKIGFQMHRTGIGSSYGRWYEKVSFAATQRINDEGGINGRPVQIIAEDDATDPVRGAEILDLFASKHRCDVVFGTLFSNVVWGSSPRAGELKLPYFVVSEGFHVASGKLNRYTLQPGITDVRSQVQAMAPFISGNLGKRITMIYPDFGFGHDHKKYFTSAIEQEGGEVIANIAISPSETSFSEYFKQIPKDTEVLYHVMVGPAVMKFIKELGEFYNGDRPEIFGFIDSLEAINLASPGLEFLDGTYLWEGYPRYAQDDAAPFETIYRSAVGVDGNGASLEDSRDISTYAHMFGCWETLNVIKAGMEASDYRGPQDRTKLIEAVESMDYLPHSLDHPQGPKIFNGRTHQVFGKQYISKLEGGRLSLVHATSITDTLYPDEVDYTSFSF
ncbi:MAG: ABC transporter substrate-binding protein [Granulosicoccus sp.]